MTSQNSKVIDKLFDLYLIQSYHYLLQLSGGHYITMDNRDKPLRRYMLENHLSGKTTVGTFASGYLTKFIAFDVDFRDNDMARWVTYKLAAELDRNGIGHAISFSGNKGYHVDVFLDKAIGNDAALRFFEFIMKAADVMGIDGGMVEFRPAAAQGIKLPLGVHQGNGRYCGFCKVEDGLTVMDKKESEEYFLSLEKTNHEVVHELITEYSHAYETKQADEMENAVARYKPLNTYDQSESYTLSLAADRYETGLTGPGQRHKSFLLLARFMNHHGIESTEAEERIAEWLTWQDVRFYSSDSDCCAKDLRDCVAYVYDNDLTLTIEQRNLTVSMAEIDAIIRYCPQKNHKALAYAMLIHSKRWAGPTGTFYMTYKQMAETAGLVEMTAKRQVNVLEQMGVVEIVDRNRKQSGTFIKRPNMYRITLSIDSDGGDSEGLFSFAEGGGRLSDCIRYYYTEAELRRILPRRQYSSLLSS
ncbi:hypothetical protein ACFQZE_11680 [Paenibacillus sp. GCM10027627]|uniref:TOTE conflict system archaeo-eukaryotic primase domain-containing protein n=1 Tax=unclassified Paenibacillus TaxID=185978 RepID=UPI00363A6B14